MQEVVDFIRQTFKSNEFIPLHEPRFMGNEKEYLNDCIDSTFVSSVGKYVDEIEEKFAHKIGAQYAVAVVNGTAALHISLLLADVTSNDEVITQPLTFIATCNAISYLGAKPIFVDVDKDTMGMSPKSLKKFLEENCFIINNQCINNITKRVIKACVPMHTFGHACRVDEIKTLCDKWHITLVEDAAESLGTYYNNQHTGTFGELSAFSFNGNKVITSGGGGIIVTNNELLAKKAKHLTTTAKVSHTYEYVHDEIGFNYRMPNLNAALLVAQLEQLDSFLASKKRLAHIYKEFFSTCTDIEFVEEPQNTNSNYWLQSVLLENRSARDEFLEFTNKNGVMSRPVWKLMTKLDMFKDCQSTSLENAKYLEERIVNIPSSAI